MNLKLQYISSYPLFYLYFMITNTFICYYLVQIWQKTPKKYWFTKILFHNRTRTIGLTILQYSKQVYSTTHILFICTARVQTDHFQRKPRKCRLWLREKPLQGTKFSLAWATPLRIYRYFYRSTLTNYSRVYLYGYIHIAQLKVSIG